MNNKDLSLEFVKKYQECRKKGVPEDCAILAVLHDLAEYKDAQYEHQSVIAHVNTYENVGEESYVEFVVEWPIAKYKEKETVRIMVLENNMDEIFNTKPISKLPDDVAEKIYKFRLDEHYDIPFKQYMDFFHLIVVEGEVYCTPDEPTLKKVKEYFDNIKSMKEFTLPDLIITDGKIYKNRYGFAE